MRIRLKVVLLLGVLSMGMLYLGLANLHFEHDKVVHAVAFALFTGLVYWVFDVSRRRTINFTLLVAIVACISSEYFQAALSTRKFDVNDIYANLIGSCISIFLNFILHGKVLDIRRKHRYDRLHHVADDGNQLELDSIGEDLVADEMIV